MSDLVVGMDSSTSQILWFDEDAKCSSVSIPVEILAEHPHLDISSNLLDCHIDICSPELMLQFSDNFDYQVKSTMNAHIQIVFTICFLFDRIFATTSFATKPSIGSWACIFTDIFSTYVSVS